MPAADPNTYGASWYAATAVAVPPRPRLAVELDVDVCVIGGGLAGLTTAREVARRGWSVVVLEAQRIACHASGRNTGFVLPGFAADPRVVVARVGLAHARSLWALSAAGVEYVRQAARAAGMPGVELEAGGWLRVSKTDPAFPPQALVDLLAGELGIAVETWSAERVRDELRSPLYFGGLHYPHAFCLHPLNYALGLAAAAEAAGARICEETPALEIDPAGVRKRVVTPAARVRAAHVVLAGNIQIRALMPQIAATLIPISTYVVTTAPLGDTIKDAIRYRGAVSDTELADNHYRVVDSDRLMWSGRCSVWRGRPQRYVKALIRDLVRTYPQLGRVPVEYAWRGTLGNTVHRMPQIGEVAPGLWLLSGFGGHGLNTTAMGGEIIARAIVEGDQTWRLFVPFELVHAGGLFGRAVAQICYWGNRARERLQGPLARKRDAAQRHDAERRRLAAEKAKAGATPARPSPGEPGAVPASAAAAAQEAKGSALAPTSSLVLPPVEFVATGAQPGGAPSSADERA
jgi:gamma-glutamylputrescine oxidase